MGPAILLAALAVLARASADCSYNPGSYDALTASFQDCQAGESENSENSNFFVNWGLIVDELTKRGDRRAGVSFQQAEKLYRKSIAIDNNAVAYVNLGVVLDRFGDIYGSIDAHRNAEKHGHANFWYPHINLALEYEKLGRMKSAIKMYDEGWKRGMEKSTVNQIQYSVITPFVYTSDKDMEYWRNRVVKHLKKTWKKRKSLPHIQNPFQECRFRNSPGYYQFGYFGYNDAKYINLLAKIYEANAPSLRYTSPQIARYGKSNAVFGKKIRVGFMSKFLREHASGKYITGVIAKLSKKKIEVVILSTRDPFEDADGDDDIVRTLRKRANKWVDVPLHSLEDTRSLIEAQNLDALVFCELGMEPSNYFLAFGRMAPLQIATHGHASTSGITGSIDFYVTYKAFESPEAQRYYSERLVTMEGLVHYPRPDVPHTEFSRKDLGLPETGNIYLIVQTVYKITPEMDAVWNSILTKDPTGYIVMKKQSYQELDDLLLKRYSKSMSADVYKRILLLSGLGHEKWFDLFRKSSVMLDSYPFGGYTTSIEAFTIGLPIVTLPHPMLAGNCTAGFLRAMNLTELIVKDKDAYVDLAVKVAQDSTYRDELTAKILERNHVLFTDKTAVKGWARFFKEAVGVVRDAAAKGEAPDFEAEGAITDLHGSRQEMLDYARYPGKKEEKKIVAHDEL